LSVVAAEMKTKMVGASSSSALRVRLPRGWGRGRIWEENVPPAHEFAVLFSGKKCVDVVLRMYGQSLYVRRAREEG
jgi:hypothetical protein